MTLITIVLLLFYQLFKQILEKVIHRRFYSFLQSRDILFKSQYGFRKGHAINQALIELAPKITQGLNDNKFTLGVFLDFSKVFDTINHQKFLRKLEYYGIRGHDLECFSSYLDNCVQFVEFTETKSSLKNSSIGKRGG